MLKKFRLTYRLYHQSLFFAGVFVGKNVDKKFHDLYEIKVVENVLPMTNLKENTFFLVFDNLNIWKLGQIVAALEKYTEDIVISDIQSVYND